MNRMKAVMLACIVVAMNVTLVGAAREAGDDKEIKFYNLQKEYTKLDTSIFKLKSARSQELKMIIEDMLSIYGKVYANEKENELYITDTPEMIKSLKFIVSKLDVKDISAGGNLYSKVIFLKHNKVSDIIGLVKHKLSKSGKIISAGDLNAIIITDVKSKTDEIGELIDKLDVPVPHILIEIAILEYNNEFFEKKGIDMISWVSNLSANINFRLGNNQSTYEYTHDYGEENYDSYERTYGDGGYNAQASAYIKIGDIISLLSTKAGAKVLATPRIITRNNNRAYVSATEEVYSHEAPSGGGRYYYYYGEGENKEAIAPEYYGSNYSRAGIYLSVLPVIQSDQFINLSIYPSISSFVGWSPTGAPIVFDRRLSTEVNVEDGKTFVLGGLQKTEVAERRIGVPILKDIPIVKFFFSKIIKSKFVRDVAIFITPRIINEGNYLPEEDKKSLEKLKKEIGE